MEPFDRAVFLAIRFENAGYEDLAERPGLGMQDFERACARPVHILRTPPPPPWWQIWRY